MADTERLSLDYVVFVPLWLSLTFYQVQVDGFAFLKLKSVCAKDSVAEVSFCQEKLMFETSKRVSTLSYNSSLNSGIYACLCQEAPGRLVQIGGPGSLKLIICCWRVYKPENSKHGKIICISNGISDTLDRLPLLELLFYRQKQSLTNINGTHAIVRQLLLCGGDIATNPGPCTNVTNVPKTKFPKCEKTVRKNQYSAACEVCYDQFHVKCADLELSNVKKQLKENQLTVEDWICSRCLFSKLPFYSMRTIDQQSEGNNQDESILTDTFDEHLEALTSRPSQLKLVHINTQSMVSSFDELLLLLKEYSYDVITMSETWLKNNPNLLNYVTIP